MNPMSLTQGSARDAIDIDQVARLRDAGVLIEDSRRERPRYFDGRFLAARDLIRDQLYFLTREADLGQASGSGVATGLFVEEGGAPQTLNVAAGHGVTPSGELVMLPRTLAVQLANIPVAEQLSARFGLSRLPQPPMRSRTGLFVLALRPVEFTANPIGAYPTSITGQRTVEDGDVIEATAVVLVPWQDDGGTDALAARRGRAARAIFTQGAAAGVSVNVLPLAMIALQNNTVEWIDEAMVRRELGADRGDLPGLGFAPRALRLAHLMQYQSHLADVATRAGGRGFAAAAHFPALPPAGPLPAGVVNVQDFTQNFFPAEVDVDFTVIPEDELPALVEEALALQPIDLTAAPEALDSTAVMILAPVPRPEWRAVNARLSSVRRLVKPAAPNLIAQRKPFEVLQKLRLPRVADAAASTTDAGSDAEWQRLARLSSLWYVRRRHLAYRDDLVGSQREISGSDERALQAALNARIEGLGLAARLAFVVQRASPAAAGTVIGLLAGKRYEASPALTAAALGLLSDAIATAEQLEGQAVLDKASALSVAAVLAEPERNEALALLLKRESSAPLAADELLRVATSGDWNTTPVDNDALLSRVFKRAEAIGLYDELKRVVGNASDAAGQAVVRLLAGRGYEASPVLTAAALALLLEVVEKTGGLKETSQVASVASALTAPIQSDVLNKYLVREQRSAFSADELRKLIDLRDEWRPQRLRARVPAAPEQAATARKAASKAVTRPAAKAATQPAAKVATKAATEVATKVATKTTAKVATKAATRAAGKTIAKTPGRKA